LNATEGTGWLDTIVRFLPDTSVAVPSALNRMSSKSAFGVWAHKFTEKKTNPKMGKSEEEFLVFI
jgi:hypothetical protein